MGVTVTVTGTRELIADFEHADTEIDPESVKVITKAAVNIKGSWRRAWHGIRHAPRIGSSISFDDVAEDDDGAIGTEIGPEDGPVLQGFLGPIIEFGGLHSAPHPGGMPALAKEEPRLTAAAEALLERLLP